MIPKETERRRFIRLLAGAALAGGNPKLWAQDNTSANNDATPSDETSPQNATTTGGDASAGSHETVSEAPPISIGLTPVFLDDQIAFLQSWQVYLQQRLQRPVQFFQRGSYSEVLRLLQDGRVDFAWLCGFPYWRNRDWLKLVAVPVYQGKPLYQAYLIRHPHNVMFNQLTDLRGKVFAYSDPDSNSGFLYPQYRLRQMKLDSRHFFGRAFFTWSHRKVVEAVAVQLAHAGSVDGYVWDVLAQLHPQLTAKTEIFERSEWFGFPPIVAAQNVNDELFSEFQLVLNGMSDDTEGNRLLKKMALDGFIQAEPKLFASIGAMMMER